jgi:hypothetical protein
MKVLSEVTHEDGSGWMATVEVRGVVFSASYVNGKVNSRMGNYKFPPRVPRWVGGYVQKWAEKQVAALPAEYHAKHRELYGVAA